LNIEDMQPPKCKQEALDYCGAPGNAQLALFYFFLHLSDDEEEDVDEEEDGDR
jgi:hypothetical protein